MLLEKMIINKEINKKVELEYFFVKGSIEIDSDYFIEKIKKACSSENNLNFKTNIQGSMTVFDFFKKDLVFIKTLKKIIEWVDDNYQFQNYTLYDAWGYELKPNEKTLYHSHDEALWCGAIYLNSSNQKLIFPEIKEELKPEKGSFALFSPFLKHGCERNKDFHSKFGLSFNMCQVRNW